MCMLVKDKWKTQGRKEGEGWRRGKYIQNST